MDRRGNSTRRDDVEGGTLLEDFVESVRNLPNEMQRNLELIRSLDSSCREEAMELADCEKAYLHSAEKAVMNAGRSENVKKVVEELNLELMEEICTKRDRATQIMDEKIAIVQQTQHLVEAHMLRLSKDVLTLDEKLKLIAAEKMNIEAPTIRNGDEVAVRLEPGEDMWVLARVIEYDSAAGTFHVLDEDDTSHSYELDEVNVIHLESSHTPVRRSEHVLAVYPDTTSFYPATIIQPSRRGGGQGYVGVQFDDDADETGMTPQRQIPAMHVIRVS
eukprot:415881_1